MTDTQVLRKQLSQKCIDILEKKCQKSRSGVEEIENSLIAEITDSIKAEFKEGVK